MELRALRQDTVEQSLDHAARGAFAAGVLDALTVPTLVLETGLVVREANRAFYRTFRAHAATTLDRSLATVEGAEWRQQELLRALERSLRRGVEMHALETEITLRHGERRWLAVSAAPVALPRQSPVLVCCLEDNTDRKRTQMQLEAQVEQLGSTAAGLLLLDARQRITFTNSAVGQMTGFTRRQLVGRLLHPMLHAVRPDDGVYPADACPIIAACRDRIVANGEEHLRRRDGSFVPVRWTTTPLRPHSDQAMGTALELHDTQAERQVQQQMLDSEKLAASGRIAATLAHEINNPLAAVSNAIYLLQNGAGLDPEKRRAVLATAGSELGRINHIVKNTLGLYRTRRQAVSLDVNEMCESALGLLQTQAKDKGVHLHRRLLARRPLLMPAGDLRQILTNLVGNAIEAAPRGGQVWVASRDSPAGCRLLVGDNGPGIRPQTRQRIFKPFFTTKGERGTGLGLWVSAELARAQGARIRVHTCTQPPTGTWFAIDLPAQSPETR